MTAKELFEILVREHADMLIAYIRAVVHDHAVAEDIFQETMLTAWRRIDDYDRQRPFGPWLRGIAARLLLSEYRASARRFAVCNPQTLEYLSAKFDDLHRNTGDTFDDKLDALRDCLEQLPTTYRETVKLKYRENMRIEALAVHLNLAVETVKKRLQRAKARLLECLKRKLAAVEV